MADEETFTKEEVNANGQRVTSLRARLKDKQKRANELLTTGASVSSQAKDIHKTIRDKKQEEPFLPEERSRFG